MAKGLAVQETDTGDSRFLRATAARQRIDEVIGGDEQHPLMDILDLFSMQIERYEQAHYPLPEASPHEVLRYLMEEHGLTQTDLADDLGGQSVVSDILHAKRQLNTRQITVLAQRFHVSPAVFFSSAPSSS